MFKLRRVSRFCLLQYPSNSDVEMVKSIEWNLTISLLKFSYCFVIGLLLRLFTGSIRLVYLFCFVSMNVFVIVWCGRRSCMVLIVLIRATVHFNPPGGCVVSYGSGTTSVRHSPAKGPKNAGEPQNRCL